MAKNLYILKDKESGEIVAWRLKTVLWEINRDHSNEFRPYNKTDWREGLSEWTTYEVLAIKKV